jgi:ketosteroid isomerase-like protein
MAKLGARRILLRLRYFMSLIRSAIPLIALLAAGAAQTATVPPPASALADVQLRVVNHRFVSGFMRADGDFMEALTDSDFLLTDASGQWLERADHLKSMREPSGLDGVSYRDVEVRLFGSAALVHGVFEATAPVGKVMRVRYLDVYSWDGAAWRLVNAQNTRLKDGVSTELQRGPTMAYGSWSGRDPEGEDLAVLKKLNESYVQAFRDSDTAWYDKHLARDYVVVYPDGSYHDRSGALANFAEPMFATHMKSFSLDQVRIRRFGDVALIHAQNVAELKDGRKLTSRYTDIWHKQDGRWLCIAAHINDDRAKP